MCAFRQWLGSIEGLDIAVGPRVGHTPARLPYDTQGDAAPLDELTGWCSSTAGGRVQTPTDALTETQRRVLPQPPPFLSCVGSLGLGKTGSVVQDQGGVLPCVM